MELERILSEIGKGRVAPCYLLFGDEEYLVRDALDKIVAQIIPEPDRDLNLVVLDGDSQDMTALCDSLLTRPLLPGRKAIVVRDTRIFHSRKTLFTLIQKIRDQAAANPARVAADFMLFLRMAGWTLEDMKDGGWQRISDEQWRQTVDDDEGRDREAWLPVMTAFCAANRTQAADVGDDADRLEVLLKKGLPEGNHLILTADTVDKRKRLFKSIGEMGRVLEFSRVKGEAKLKGRLMDNAREFLAARGKKLAPGAWLVLGKKTGFDLRASMAALEKLVTFSADRAVIDEADVEAAIGKTREENVFNLTGALAERNLPAALTVLSELLNQGSAAPMILAMLAREIRTLLQARLLLDMTPRIAWQAGMDYGRFQKALFPEIRERLGTATPHPYVIYQALGHAGRFTQQSLLRHMESLVDMDLAMKSTMQDPRLMLERFLIQVCH